MKTIQEPVTCAIWHAIHHYAYRDAIFLAERLYAEVSSPEALYMLATAYYHSGKPKVVCSLLETQISYYSPECKLLYAQACWDLERFSKVESAILGWNISDISLNTTVTTFTDKLHNVEIAYGDSACYALNLLGRVMLKTERPRDAQLCFKTSLKLNPFLWTSFEYMCKAGLAPEPRSVFTTENIPSFTTSSLYNVQAQPKKSVKFFEAPKSKPLSQSKTNINENTKIHNSPLPSTTPSNHGSIKTNPPVMRQCQRSAVTNDIATVTPPSTKVNFGGDTGESLLKNIQSSAILNRDTSTLGSPANEFFRSTPGHDGVSQWDSSVESVNVSSVRRTTRSQQRIMRGLIGNNAAISPLTPSFGVVPLGDTPSPERMVSPDEISNQADVKMTTRQAKKPSDPVTTVHGKLLFSSTEINRRISKIHNDEQTITPPNQHFSSSVRRSNRINANSSSSKENAKRRSRFMQPKSSLKKNSKQRQAAVKPARDLSEEIRRSDLAADKIHQLSSGASQAIATQKIATEGLMALLHDLGSAYRAMTEYKCAESIDCFARLSHNQLRTGWVLSNLARSYFEMNDYEKAASVFRELRMLFPYYIEGLEIYSTTLWHLKDEVELSKLAHDMKDFDHLAPETWCAIGNCFSLQQDHVSASSFLHRSVQLNNGFAYGHTLLGHELAATDDLNGALSCFRSALRCNSRHYNAWYGIGSVYYKQEKYSLAEIHFRKALAINPRSSVLLCHIGMVEHALKKTKAALETLDAAVTLEPRNPLCKFHRATVLLAAEKHQEAIKELTELKQLVPKESPVYFLLGKVYKKIGKNHLAMSNFSLAMDLDPKGTNNQIKEAIDKYNVMDDDSFSRHEMSAATEDDESAEMDESEIQSFFVRRINQSNPAISNQTRDSDDSL